MSTSWTPTTARPRRPGSPPGPSVEPRVLRDVAAAILPPPSPADMRICRVSARDTTARTISVELGADSANPVSGVRIANTSYYPRINDLAVIVQQRSDLYALGAVNAKVGAVRVWRSTDQTITNDADVAVIFDTELDSDTDGIWSGGNPTRLTLPWPGRWLVGGSIVWPASGITVANRSVRVIRNGSELMFRDEDQYDPATAHVMAQSASLSIEAVAGDYVEIIARQGGTGGLTLPSLPAGGSPPGYAPTAWAHWLGPG